MYRPAAQAAELPVLHMPLPVDCQAVLDSVTSRLERKGRQSAISMFRAGSLLPRHYNEGTSFVVHLYQVTKQTDTCLAPST